MARFDRMLVMPGEYTAAVLWGACAAVDATRERARWHDAFIASLNEAPLRGVRSVSEMLDVRSAHAERVKDDAAAGFNRAERLVRRYGCRVAKRHVTRAAYESRRNEKRARSWRFLGIGEMNVLRHYRPSTSAT